MDGFFDDFASAAPGGEEVLFSDDDFLRLRELFLDRSLGLEELHAQYKRLLEEMLSSRGKTVQWAQERHGHYPYVAAYTSTQELELIRSEAVAAADECTDITGTKEEWVPPPPDEEPETAADYE